MFPHGGRHPSYCFHASGRRLLIDPKTLSVNKLVVAPQRSSFDGVAARRTRGVLDRIALGRRRLRPIVKRFRNFVGGRRKGAARRARRDLRRRPRPRIGINVVDRRHVHFSLGTACSTGNSLIHNRRAMRYYRKKVL